MSPAAERVLHATQKCDAALTALYQAFQELARKDTDLLAALRDRYNIPHLFSLLAEAQAEVADSIANLGREHPDL